MKKAIGLSLLALTFASYGGIMIKSKEKIAFLGDSITQQGHTFDGGYVNLVMDGLSLSGVKAVMIPAGRGGAKSDYMLENLEDKVLKHKPDWMTLSCGVNDVGHGERGIGLEQYKKNITEILDRCRKAGVKVIVLTPTLCTDSKGWEKHPNNLKLDGYCDFLRKTAAERKLPLVDLNKIHKEKRAAADRPEEGLTSDALHMNGFGNQMMAIAILETMGLSGKQIEKCKLSWKRGKRGFSATGNNTGMVTLDAWEEIKHRAKMQNKSPRQYVQDKIESRVPDINWRRKTYETQELRLSGKAASFDGCVSPLVRITPENAMGDASAKTIKLSSWKNERANAQFVVWTKDAVNQVRVKASCLKGASGTIGADAVDTRFVRYTTASSIRPYGDNPITSYVGDILDDAKTLDMNANTFRPVWVTVKVPENAAAGEYKGSIDVIGAGGKKVSFNIELEVADRTLPKPADWKFFLDLWQHPWAVARYHSVEPFSKQHYDLMKPLWEELANAGQKVITTTITELPWNHQNFDAYHSMVRHVKKADGTFKRDFSLWDEYVDFCLKCGLGPQIHCYTMATWGHIVYWEDEATGDIQKAKLVPGTKEHEEFWGPFLSEFRDHLKATGKLGNVYIALDERSREELYATANLIKKCAPELKLAMAGNKKPSEFKGITMDNYCQYISHITPDYLEEVHATRPSDKFTSTFYVCCGPNRPNTFTDSPLPESAWIGLYAAAAKIDGLLRWAYVNWPLDPVVDSSFGHWRAGDTYLVYPNCRASSRWEMLRDGIEECEKIRILRAEGKAAKIEEALKEINFPKGDKASDETIAADVANVLKAVSEASK